MTLGEFPSRVTEGPDLWVLQGISTTAPTRAYEPTLVKIAMSRSRDGGKTLEAPVSVGDPMAGPRTMRAMATLQSDQSLSLVYYAGAKDNDPAATVRRSRSTDGGKTFGASQTLHSPVVLTTSRTGNDWLGDLLGVTSDARNSFVAFVDNQSGASRIRFSRLALASP